MSGCHDSDSHCLHGLSQRLQCELCDMVKRLADNEHYIQHCHQAIEKYFDKIEQLERRQKVTRELFDVFVEGTNNRLEKLESSKLSQELDPKVWVFVNERLDKLENAEQRQYKVERIAAEQRQNKFEHIADLEKRVKDIEYRISHIVELPNELDIRLQEVERKVDKLFDNFTQLKKEIYCNKKPHCCPVCEGNKVRIYLNTDVDGSNFKSQVQENNCHVCEGKGIIWEKL
jgi:vacuolar-type H+-ATPase subunit I/STV1